MPLIGVRFHSAPSPFQLGVTLSGSVPPESFADVRTWRTEMSPNPGNETGEPDLSEKKRVLNSLHFADALLWYYDTGAEQLIAQIRSLKTVDRCLLLFAAVQAEQLLGMMFEAARRAKQYEESASTSRSDRRRLGYHLEAYQTYAQRMAEELACASEELQAGCSSSVRDLVSKRSAIWMTALARTVCTGKLPKELEANVDWKIARSNEGYTGWGMLS